MFIATPLVTMHDGSGTTYDETGKIDYKVIQTLKGALKAGDIFGGASFWGQLDKIYVGEEYNTHINYDSACFPGFSAISRYYLIFPDRDEKAEYYISHENVYLLGNDADSLTEANDIYKTVNKFLDIQGEFSSQEERLVALGKLYKNLRRNKQSDALYRFTQSHLYAFSKWQPTAYLVEGFRAINQDKPMRIKANAHTVTIPNPVRARPIYTRVIAYCDRRGLAFDWEETQKKCLRNAKPLFVDKIVSALAQGQHPDAVGIIKKSVINHWSERTKALYFLFLAKNEHPDVAIDYAEKLVGPWLRKRNIDTDYLDELIHILAKIKREYAWYEGHCNNPAYLACDDNDDEQELWQIIPGIREWWPGFIMNIHQKMATKDLEYSYSEDYYEREISYLGQEGNS